MIELSLVDQETPNSCITAHPYTTFLFSGFGTEPGDQKQLPVGRRYIRYPANHLR